MVEHIAHVGHVDAVHDLAEVRSTRVRPDHGDEIWIGCALRDGGGVEKTFLLLSVRAVAARRRSRDERDDESRAQRQHAERR
jgi:hypothetical protein